MQEEQSRVVGIIKRLIRVDRCHRAMIEAQVNRLGIHRSQHNVLMYLYYCREAPTQDQIARTFEITPAAVAATLKKLEAAGLVERDIRKENGREKEVRLTDEGLEIVRISQELFASADEKILRGFTEEEMGQLEDFLDRMAENMKNSE